MQMGSGLIVFLVALLAVWILGKFLQRQLFLRKLAVARITAEELRDKLDAGENLLIIDLRSGLQTESSSIPGALRISAEELAERHGDIPRDRDVILLCS
jgi:hypothetical protein